jgi:hypothetical protein
MKLTAIVLATAFALSSTAALAQAQPAPGSSSVATGPQGGTAGFGSVVAPSVGSYVWPSVGSTLAVPTWRNTGPAAPLPGTSPTSNAPFGPAIRR